MKKTNWIIVAVISGIAAAALHVSVIALSPLSVLLFYLAPLPLFIAGLSYGWVPAAVAAGVGSLATSGFLGFKSALFFLGASALGPLVITRLALIHRPAAQMPREGEAKDGNIEWYPEGRLLLWAAALAGTLLTVIIFIAGPDADSFHATLKEFSQKLTEPFIANIEDTQREGFRQFVDFLVLIAPLASAAAWFVATLLNFLMASRLLRAWNMSLRPWARFSSLAFPRSAGLALVAACAVSFLPGTAGLMGSVFAIPLCVAFAVLGLAVIHHLLQRSSSRIAILAGLYAALVFFNWIVALPLMALGIAELVWHVRARADRHALPKIQT